MNVSYVHALPPLTILFILGASFLFLCFVYYRFSVPARLLLRVILFLLRAVLLLVIFFIILDPYWRRAKENEWIGVLLDTSASMLVRDAGLEPEISRIEQLKKYLKDDPYWQELKEKKLRQIAAFDSQTEKIHSVDGLEAKGSASRLLAAVKEINAQYHADPDLLGFIVFSDGAATEDAAEQKEILTQPLFPWIAVGLGKKGKVSNLRMTAPEVPKYVFVSEIVPLKIHWESTLPPGTKAMLHVLLDHRPVFQKEINTQDGLAEAKLSIAVPGEHVLDIRMDPVEGEGSVEDNYVRIWVQANTRQIRVFYAESFYKDKNYFKEALEEDADFNVTFVSSLIGFARKYNVPFIKNPLYGFPKTREELLQYDVLVLSDVKRSLLTPDQMKWIRELVREEGGALIMVGGMDSFGDGGYAGTDIEGMLPVEISEEYKKETFLTAKGTAEHPFRPLIPDGAGAHPILQLEEQPAENEALWKTMPLLGGYNFVGRLKPGGFLLLKHPVDVSAFGSRVILAVQNFGKGKVMAFTSDITPNWGKEFQDWRDEKHGWLYAKFWRNTLKWLTENRARQRIAPLDVKWDPPLAEEDKPLEFTVNLPEAKDEDQNASLRIEILKEGKALFQKEFGGIHARRSLSWKLSSLTPGDYLFIANYFRENGLPLQLKTSFTVHPSRIESRNMEFRPGLLRALARQSEGVYLPFSRVGEVKEAIKKIRKARLRQYSMPFWDHPWLYLLILALLSFDWFIRKRKGLE